MRVMQGGILLALFIGSLWPPAASSSDFFGNMIDPDDGKFDVSDYLASGRGFLPVPIIVTEPAVGYGFGLWSR